MAKGGDYEGCGSIVFWTILFIVCITSAFLPLRAQRAIYFSMASPPEVPKGGYAAVSIKSWSYVRPALSSDYYSVEVEGSEPYAVMSADPAWEGLFEGYVRYRLRCIPRFWNRCAAPDMFAPYGARWVSSAHEELAVGKITTDSSGKPEVTDVTIYTVDGWTTK